MEIHEFGDPEASVVLIEPIHVPDGMEAEAEMILKLAGLDPARNYKVTEQNVDSSCWWGNGKAFRGDFLMSGGFNPQLQQTNASAVFVLEAE